MKLFKEIDFDITEEEWMHLAAKFTIMLQHSALESEELLIKGLKSLKSFILKIEGNVITSELLFSLGIVEFLNKCMHHQNGFVVLEACELLATVVTESADNFTLPRAFAETKLAYEMY